MARKLDKETLQIFLGRIIELEGPALSAIQKATLKSFEGLGLTEKEKTDMQVACMIGAKSMFFGVQTLLNELIND